MLKVKVGQILQILSLVRRCLKHFNLTQMRFLADPQFNRTLVPSGDRARVGDEIKVDGRKVIHSSREIHDQGTFPKTFFTPRLLQTSPDNCVCRVFRKYVLLTEKRWTRGE